VLASEDADSPTVISAERMRHSLLAGDDKGEVDVDEMLAALDPDGDGRVRVEDFVRLLVCDDEFDGDDGREDGGQDGDGEGERRRRCKRCVIL